MKKPPIRKRPAAYSDFHLQRYSFDEVKRLAEKLATSHHSIGFDCAEGKMISIHPRCDCSKMCWCGYSTDGESYRGSFVKKGSPAARKLVKEIERRLSA